MVRQSQDYLAQPCIIYSRGASSRPTGDRLSRGDSSAVLSSFLATVRRCWQPNNVVRPAFRAAVPGFESATFRDDHRWWIRKISIRRRTPAPVQSCSVCNRKTNFTAYKPNRGLRMRKISICHGASIPLTNRRLTVYVSARFRVHNRLCFLATVRRVFVYNHPYTESGVCSSRDINKTFAHLLPTALVNRNSSMHSSVTTDVPEISNLNEYVNKKGEYEILSGSKFIHNPIKPRTFKTYNKTIIK